MSWHNLHNWTVAKRPEDCSQVLKQLRYYLVKYSKDNLSANFHNENSSHKKNIVLKICIGPMSLCRIIFLTTSYTIPKFIDFF